MLHVSDVALVSVVLFSSCVSFLYVERRWWGSVYAGLNTGTRCRSHLFIKPALHLYVFNAASI